MKAELIRVYGSDDVVVDAARVSFDKIAANYTEEQNAKLISYLAKHDHWSPFAHVSIQMRETVPIFIARQRFKHRIGFEYNEVSRRYVDTPPELFYPNEWRGKPVNAKQGSSDEVINLWNYSWHDREDESGWTDWSIGEELAEAFDRILITYRRMIEVGVAPEQARMILPQSMYTSYYVTGSLAAWARAYKLRSEETAQKEIQDLAHQWGDIIGGIGELKYSWQALTSN